MFKFNICNLIFFFCGLYILNMKFLFFIFPQPCLFLSLNIIILFLVLFLIIIFFINRPEGNFDWYILMVVIALMNILFVLNNFFLIFILLELISYCFFFFFLKQVILKGKYKNYTIIYYNIILNFFASVCFFLYLLLSMWYTGFSQFSMYSILQNLGKNICVDILIFGIFIKIGLVPFFFYKFNFYKFLSLILLFFYTYLYSIYLIYVLNILTYLNYSYVYVVYIILLTIFMIIYSLQFMSIKEMLFFSSAISFLFLIFLTL